ncbi:MAG TPA: YeeE/YedE thiosulfate transporter family protein [Steroidobacteraceae bacterium]|nr:YeeE/YedE thiosulfate transporter family protein [Steroidobacteraceae bacterium]
MNNFFPNGWLHYLIGGLLIGSSVALLFIFNGWIAGMSTVFSSTWSYFSSLPYFKQERFISSRAWRLILAAGLIIGALIWMLMFNHGIPVHTVVPWWRLFIGGLLVGYGTRLANGCTSGHGICGLGSLQLPSLVAVITFIATAVATALIFRMVMA